MPPQCKLVHINHLARHGSRYSTKMKRPDRLLKSMSSADAAGGFTELGEKAWQWTLEFHADQQKHLGEEGIAESSLAPGGWWGVGA